MSQRREAVAGPVLLAVLAVLACSAYLFSTVTVTRSVFTWEATRTGAPVPLVLAAQSPEHVLAEGPCGVSPQQPRDLVLTGDSGQALTVRSGGGQVWMEYSGRPVGQLLASPAGCTLRLDYSRASNLAVLTVGDGSTTAALVPPDTTAPDALYRQYAVTKLWAAPGVAATVTTQPTSFSSSNWRIVWLAACLGCLVLLGYRLRRPAEPGPPLAQGPLWSRTDGLVAGVAVIALVVVPPHFDDGWVLTTVRQYPQLGFFSNYYSNDAVAQPQGFWWTWLERLWLSGLGTPGFLLRLPTVIILVATWWFLRRKVLHPLGISPVAVTAAAVVACAALIGLQTTIRPEPMVAALLAAAITVVMHYARTRSPHLLVVLAGLSAFALSAHQSGWVVVTASCAALPWALPWLRTRGAPIVAASIVATGAATCLTLATLGSNLTLWLRSLTAFRRDTTTYHSLLDEGDRIAGVATRFDVPAVTIMAVALILLSIVGFLLRGAPGSLELRAAGWASVSGIGGLILTSSKLVDHYGAVIPAAVILTGITVAGLRRTVAVGMVLAVTVVGLTAAFGGGLWSLGSDRVTRSDQGVWPSVAVLLLLVSASVALVALLRGRPLDRLVTLVLAVSTSCALVLSLAPVVVEGFEQPGSWFGQQLGVLHGRTCGLIDVVTMYQPTEQALANPVTEVSSPASIGPGTVAWAKGPVFGVITAQVGLEDGSSEQISLASGANTWRMVPLPAGATSISVRQPGVAVALADRPVSAPASDVAAAQPDAWWLEPGVGLQAPCLRSVSIADGTLSGLQASVGGFGWVSAGVVPSNGLLYEAGCAGQSPSGTGVCLVRVDPVADGMTGRTVSEQIG